jgi:hypothetical protein
MPTSCADNGDTLQDGCKEHASHGEDTEDIFTPARMVRWLTVPHRGHCIEEGPELFSIMRRSGKEGRKGILHVVEHACPSGSIRECHHVAMGYIDHDHSAGVPTSTEATCERAQMLQASVVQHVTADPGFAKSYKWACSWVSES